MGIFASQFFLVIQLIVAILITAGFLFLLTLVRGRNVDRVPKPNSKTKRSGKGASAKPEGHSNARR